MVFYYGDIYTLFAKLLRIKRKPNLQCLTVHMFLTAYLAKWLVPQCFDTVGSVTARTSSLKDSHTCNHYRFFFATPTQNLA